MLYLHLLSFGDQNHVDARRSAFGHGGGRTSGRTLGSGAAWGAVQFGALAEPDADGFEVPGDTSSTTGRLFRRFPNLCAVLNFR